MEYNFREIEKKWQQQWKATNAYRVSNNSAKPKYYVLDMFPYPSGSGLHVGHPLGYIASDIYSRYKRLKGFNVLHPMGYDAFGLPAEQYAIDQGIHPAISTETNIATFRKQLEKIGFSYDWSREIRTCDERYYKWTQWIFLQLFDSWFNRISKKAERISELVAFFETEGNTTHTCPGNSDFQFSAGEWKAFDEKRKREILMNYRLAFCGVGEVNWCEALGTVLANDEVVNGVSERGGHAVERKKLRQWYLRITEYADRLLDGLKQIEFSDAMNDMQTNWIGKSVGADIAFTIKPPLTPPEGEDRKDSERHRETARASTYGLLKELSKEQKKNSTEAENLLWEKLRAHKAGYHIRRQHIIDQYIVDFVCLEKQVTIEVDGGYHHSEEQKEYDTFRTKFLNELGFEEIRFTNDEVKNNIEIVVEKIIQKLNSKPSVGKVTPTGGDLGGASLHVYTTRPDTIFGVDFMVLAPELELIKKITSAEQKKAVEEYLTYVKSRSERERMAEKKITGVFTGAYALNPFDNREIPIWISEYVLAGYGTGAIMGVPCGDERDHKFAKHFNIPITNIIGNYYNAVEANPTKDALLENSGFINGMKMSDAIAVVNDKLEELGMGKRKTNYKMRDAAFSRQRYWGEPFPIVWKDGVAYPLPESALPLTLPSMDEIKPGKEGESPLSNNQAWVYDVEKYFTNADASQIPPLGGALETNTMPGYAGSSWYFLRYMDPENDNTFCDRKISDYWGQVDLYVGGTEHAVGHLLYSRMWTKALYDLGYIGFDEPFKKLLNQGMIQGSSRFVYRILPTYLFKGDKKIEKYSDELVPIYISKNQYDAIQEQKNRPVDFLIARSEYEGINKWFFEKHQKDRIGAVITPIHVDVNIVDGVELDIDAFRKSKPEYKDAILVCEDGSVSYPGGKFTTFISGVEIEKMSKSKFNTVNPDDLVLKYGADTFRMYEMFLGPIEMSKPWDTKGIEGVHRFLKKLWRLFFDEIKGQVWNEEAANASELKILHKTIKKITDDTERFSFNTVVSAFMVCVNELNDAKCHKKEILEQLVIMLSPYAPHVAEELWHCLGCTGSVLDASFPLFEQNHVVENEKEYPVSINGKLRTTLSFPVEATQADIEPVILQNKIVQKWLDGKPPKKIIFVKGKMINVVI